MIDTSMRYDVCVVGAGPAGSTCAFYLARGGLRVLLLEKHRFPRDKICGDAVCRMAHPHLERMGVLQALLREKRARYTASGGFVSPAGVRYAGDSASHDGAQLVLTVKRVHLDEAMARAAAAAGAELGEQRRVIGASFEPRRGEWRIQARARGAGPESRFRTRVLVAADGANSPLGRALGLIRSAPQAVCSRAYLKAGSHRFPYDGMVYYPRELLPGYVGIQREADGDVNYCVFIVPGGRYASRDLRRVHHRLLESNPWITRDLGTQVEGERMRAAPLRMGGIARSFGDHLLAVGDAAGQIDPLTGEGIQYAIEGASIAARTLEQAFAEGDLGRRSLARYHRRWMTAFGRDFFWARQMSRLQARLPLLLDAFADLSNERGMDFMIQWARIMTGIQPKRDLLRPGLALPLLPAIARRAVKGVRPRHLTLFRSHRE
ncbi:MAG: NAD(P)/FAD-dependent oxidoreductase [Deltaproteobacteria bacterium]|nr:NAD(P)/FAD-dependent oxidoreductase [Deltaproteobacteria bacterium]